jgi:hypothetical protein
MKCPNCENDGKGAYPIYFVEVIVAVSHVGYRSDGSIERVDQEEIEDRVILCTVCGKCDFAAPLSVFDEEEPWEGILEDEQGKYFIPDYSLRLDEFHLKGSLYFDNGHMGEMYSKLYRIHKAKRIEDLPKVHVLDDKVVRDAVLKKIEELKTS